MSNENITAPTTSDYSLNPQLSYLGTKTRLEFKGSWLKQDKIVYDHDKVVNIDIVYEKSKNFNSSSYSTLENVRLIRLKMLILISINILDTELDLIDTDFCSHSSSRTGRNAIIFGVHVSSPTKIDNMKKDILILGKGPTEGLEHTLSAEKMYSINFTENEKISL